MSNDALREALERILEVPKDTMSDGKALREIVKIAREALAAGNPELEQKPGVRNCTFENKLDIGVVVTSENSKPGPQEIHSCSYYCERPECIKSQRDELRGRMESKPEPSGEREELIRKLRETAEEQVRCPYPIFGSVGLMRKAAAMLAADKAGGEMRHTASTGRISEFEGLMRIRWLKSLIEKQQDTNRSNNGYVEYDTGEWVGPEWVDTVHEALDDLVSAAEASKGFRFLWTRCSSCGQEFGPGDCGYSHCSDHVTHPQPQPVPDDVAKDARGDGICAKCKEPIKEIADCNSATCPTMKAFNDWWFSSKYMQVVTSSASIRQAALDGWNAAIDAAMLKEGK